MSPATETAGLKIRKLPHNRQNSLRPPCLHDSEEAHTMPSNKTPLSETTDNALADFPALQDLFEQADEDLRAFYEALSVRLNDYALIDGALSASPAAGPQIRRFLELLDRDVAAFRRAEPAATALSLRALQRMGKTCCIWPESPRCTAAASALWAAAFPAARRPSSTAF